MKAGFTLLEIIIIIALIGLLARFGLPALFSTRIPLADKFIARLNAFVQQGAQVAVQTSTVQTIRFNFGSQKVEREGSKAGIEIPSDIELRDIVINGESQMGKNRVTEVHFYITPEGLSQRVTLMLTDHTAKAGSAKTGSIKRGEYTLVLNPFTVQFAQA